MQRGAFVRCSSYILVQHVCHVAGACACFLSLSLFLMHPADWETQRETTRLCSSQQGENQQIIKKQHVVQPKSVILLLLLLFMFLWGNSHILCTSGGSVM